MSIMEPIFPGSSVAAYSNNLAHRVQNMQTVISSLSKKRTELAIFKVFGQSDEVLPAKFDTCSCSQKPCFTLLACRQLALQTMYLAMIDCQVAR